MERTARRDRFSDVLWAVVRMPRQGVVADISKYKWQQSKMPGH